MEDALSAIETAVEQCNKNDWGNGKESIHAFLSYEPAMRNISAGTFLQSINEVLKTIAEKLSPSAESSTQVPMEECATECFRCLRQVCALNSNVQKSIIDFKDVLEYSKSIISTHLGLNKDSDEKGLLKCAVQFLGNACASNAENQRYIWSQFIHLFRPLVHHSDYKLCDYTCMVIHTCLTTLASADLDLLKDEDVQDIVLTCIQETVERDMKWGLYVLEDMLKNDLFMQTLYHKLGVNEKLLMVELILADVSDMREEENAAGGGHDVAANNNNDEGQRTSTSSSCSYSSSSLPICPANIYFLAGHMKQQCNNLLELKTPESADHEMALVIVKELEILGIAASHTGKFPDLKEDTELLSTAVNILTQIHMIGKSGQNAFTKVEKASKADHISPNHPVYGLKKDLIRLIANMSYRHRKNQDLVRSLEGIPLLLDLTMIDAHNPYITQWVVLAIRNLLEDNAENRQVMTGMSLQGLAGHISTLRKMGVDTELRGGKIVVKPTKEQLEKQQQQQPPK